MASSNILQIASTYSLYSDCLTFSFGFIGNVLNLLVFTQLKCFRTNRCALYLTIELISIFPNRLLSLILTISASIYDNDLISTSLIWCRSRYIIFQTTGLVSYSMICLAAADQFFSTNYRLHLRQMCTFKLARCFIFLSISIWFLHSLLFAFFLDIYSSSGCIISNHTWIQYSTYFFYPILSSFFPLVTTSSFSLLAYRNVRRIVRRQIPIERRRFDHQITAMVLVRSVVFVFLLFPFSSYRIYAINTTFNRIGSQQYAIGLLIQSITTSFINVHFTISFYLYVIVSSRYRRQVKQVLKKQCWQRWKNWCCAARNQVAPENPVPVSSNNELE